MSVESKIDDVLQAVQALAMHMDERFATKDDLKHFATKDDLKNFEIVMKKDLRQFEERMTNRITSHIDEFVVVHRTSDMELAAVRSRCDRMEDFMEDVADKLDMNFERT